MGKNYIATVSLLALVATVAPGTAFAQARTHSQPALPLSEALQRIAAEWGKPLNIDPDAVRGITARPVNNARSERDAVAQATRGLPVAVEVNDAGVITILNDVVVIARPNEAETNVLVRGATSSSRLGQSLRDQARNTQVISAKLLERQQAQTMAEALANAGGVVVNTATVQGGVSYSVRGFDSNGAVNGLPSVSSSSFAAGTTQSLVNIERIEVLKGPDAILLGGDNLGGTINIVTKKPNAEERLYVSTDTGSFGLARGTLDANHAITTDNRVSARVVATAATADRNFGGYRGTEDYLLAPSLRYKNATTDAIVSAVIGNQIFGMVPYTVLNPNTKRPYDVAFDRPLVGGSQQFIQIGTTQFNAEITQKVTDWLTIVGRAQHQDASFALSQYSPFQVLNNSGLLLLSSSGVRQKSQSNVFDAFARIAFKTGPLTHSIVAGATNVDNEGREISAENGGMFPYNFLTPPATIRPLATTYRQSATGSRTQRGYYGQYLLGVGPLHLMAAIRHNILDTKTVTLRETFVTHSTATTPNFGAVFDVTDTLSLFGTLAYGYQPTFSTNSALEKLPDVKTRNAEAGVKWDLFDERVLINASYFSIRQSNLIDRDPVNPAFQIALPGQLGEGIDLNVAGTPIRGLTVSAAYTRTNYKFLVPTPTIGNTVNGQPRDVFNGYLSYEGKVGRNARAGVGAGVTGRSSSAIDRLNVSRIDGTTLVNLNGFLSLGALDINIGVRNLFDRKFYAPTRFDSYIPLGEPRTWRVTVGYRFF